MRKFLSLFMVLALCLPSAAFADVLSDSWQDATLDELLAAQQDIANQISALRAAQTTAADKIELTGSGTSIVSDVNVSFSPARLTVTVDGEMNLTLMDEDMNEDSETVSNHMSTVFADSGVFTLLVEAAGDWTITFEPIIPGGTLPMSGSSSYVSDIIELAAPTIVTISADASDVDNFTTLYVYLAYVDDDGDWNDDRLVDQWLNEGETYSADIILKPAKGASSYFIFVKCNSGTKWSIAPKQ